MSIATLPAEILYLIIEFAIRHDLHGRTASNLELVSRAFRIWTGPLFYRTILLQNPSSLIGFSELVRFTPEEDSSLEVGEGRRPSDPATITRATRRDRGFYRTYVRHLSITETRVPSSVLEPIFQVCTGVITLELDPLYNAYRRVGEETGMRPAQLIVHKHAAASFDGLNLFSRITHLWINVPHLHFWMRREGLPNALRCLSIPLLPSELGAGLVTLRDILKMDRMELLVINLLKWRNSEELWQAWELLDDVKDGRTVVFSASLTSLGLEDVMRSSESLWTRAVREGLRHVDFANIPLRVPRLEG